MNTAERIAALRREAGLSQEKFAERLAVSRSLVAKWETGILRPDARSVAAMSVLFGVTEDSIAAPDPLAAEELERYLPGDGGGDPDRLVKLVEAFLWSLGEKERNIFIRRYHFYERPAEIAERFGMSQGAVRISLFRARRKLREFMNSHTE